MKVTYIGHSGFSVELAQSTLLFDYYQGEIPAFHAEKPLFVFVSHKHADHFQHKIFQLAKTYPQVTFLLSRDTKMSEKYQEKIGVPEEAKGRIFYLGRHEKAEYQTAEAKVAVQTLESTDEGVAFLVHTEGKTIYHAGDLNWWTWPGEESEAEYRDMTARFFREMEWLKGISPDVAFVPLDPRQGDRYYWGLDAFMKASDARAVFPMHFWEDYRVFEWIQACPESEGYRERIREIHRPGEVFYE
jgi:L-ascorbate metabolism protein UlaG (beta-lactamase superfamily)